ncbi:putative tbc domain-containing protein [Diplodia seriata]|nr:putative tbc domain-containing protein [Diplodia seriata]
MHPVNILSGPPVGLDGLPTPRESLSSRDSLASAGEGSERPPPVAPPLPHLPLRKRSSQRLRQRAASPLLSSPLNESRIPRSAVDYPSPTRSTRSTRSRQTSTVSKPYTDDPAHSLQPSPLGSPISTRTDADEPDEDIVDPLPDSIRIRPRASSHTISKPQRTLRTSTSIPNLAQLRAREVVSAQGHRRERRSTVRDSYLSMLRREPPGRPLVLGEEMRSSYRSNFTNSSSGFVDASGTERSSIISERSGMSTTPYTTDYENTDVEKTDFEQTDAEQELMTVEDAIDMYEMGFEDDPADVPEGSDEGYASQVPTNTTPGEAQTPPRVRRHSTSSLRDSGLGPDAPADHYIPYVTPSRNDRVSKIMAEQDLAAQLPPPQSARSAKSARSARSARSAASGKTNKSKGSISMIADKTFSQMLAPRMSVMEKKVELKAGSSIPRDQYGFKKATQYITVEQYDAWNAPYREYTERRRKKWQNLMRQHGLPISKPTRFPPRSEKVKRFIRKGIPPEWRGAAWFYYGGGPARQAANPGLYWELVEQVNDGQLSEQDREHIERDLNRTFPDNVRFRPESRASMNAAHLLDTKSTDLTPDCETPILRALRRVLQAFAVHNPGIGYCQSLNFLAGLLLIFLDEDEEKAFIMLDIITSVHLPGTHGRVLEANIDIGVLMHCIRESMPAIWNKIDDTKEFEPNVTTTSARLPTVSLAMTSWFMSLFVGNFPIETVLRVWDSFFYEGSKTLFRIALAILKIGEAEIRAISDPMEVFQIIQTLPRRLIDPNSLMDACFRRRNGFGHVKQETIDARRVERRRAHQQDIARISGNWAAKFGKKEVDAQSMRSKSGGVRRAASKRFKNKRRARTDQP